MINTVSNISSGYGLNPNLYTAEQRKNVQKEQKEQLVKKQYSDIFEHEKAHKDAAGSLGGNIVIENNSEGIPVKGHVDVKMPVLDEKNPDKTIEHADTVIKSAMAPQDPSSQDYKVANEAQQTKSEAQQLKNDKSQPGAKLNLVA